MARRAFGGKASGEAHKRAANSKIVPLNWHNHLEKKIKTLEKTCTFLDE